MAVLTPTAFWNKWGATTGIFLDNTTRQISEADMRDFVTDIRDSVPTWATSNISDYEDLTALSAAIPDGSSVKIATLSKGVGVAGNIAFWDSNDSIWREVSVGGSVGLDDLTDVAKGTPAANSSGTLRVIGDPDNDGNYVIIDWTPPGSFVTPDTENWPANNTIQLNQHRSYNQVTVDNTTLNVLLDRTGIKNRNEFDVQFNVINGGQVTFSADFADPSDGASSAPSITDNGLYFVAGFYRQASSSNKVIVAIPALTSGSDTTAPLITGAEVGSISALRLILTYNEALDTGSTPALGDYSILSGGVANPATLISVTGNTVDITLTNAVLSTDAVTVSYTAGANPIRDLAVPANNAANLTNHVVTNNVAPDTTDPIWATINFEIGNVDSSTLVMPANEALDSTSSDVSHFTVRVATVIRTISSLSFGNSDTEVRLALSSPVSPGEAVTVTYNGNGQLNSIRDVSGNEINNLLTETAATNNVSAYSFGNGIKLVRDSDTVGDEVKIGNISATAITADWSFYMWYRPNASDWSTITGWIRPFAFSLGADPSFIVSVRPSGTAGEYRIDVNIDDGPALVIAGTTAFVADNTNRNLLTIVKDSSRGSSTGGITVYNNGIVVGDNGGSANDAMPTQFETECYYGRNSVSANTYSPITIGEAGWIKNTILTQQQCVDEYASGNGGGIIDALSASLFEFRHLFNEAGTVPSPITVAQDTSANNRDGTLAGAVGDDTTWITF